MSQPLAYLPPGLTLAAQSLLAADLAYFSCVFWEDLRLPPPSPCVSSASYVGPLRQSRPRSRPELEPCLSLLHLCDSHLRCAMVRSWRLTRRTLAFVFRGKVRALAEDGFLELLLDTTRLEQITVPMMSGILWLQLPSERRRLSLRVCLFLVSRASLSHTWRWTHSSHCNTTRILQSRRILDGPS